MSVTCPMAPAIMLTHLHWYVLSLRLFEDRKAGRITEMSRFLQYIVPIKINSDKADTSRRTGSDNRCRLQVK